MKSRPKKPKIFILVGTTASGKTDLSVELARRYPIEIINADSLQVFRFMDIGTAKPSNTVREQVPHHMIDVLDPDAEYTAKQYKIEAEKQAFDILQRKKIPLFVGGAGFYLKAISNPITDLPEGVKKIQDPEEEYKILIQKDPALVGKIHPNDHYRMSRALFLLDHGILPSQAFKVRHDSESMFEIQWLGVAWDRDRLRDRIDKRVRLMFEAGLMDETKNILKQFPKSRFRLERSIGYSECLQAMEGDISLEKATELTTIATQQYAKRQRTWFRRNMKIQWSSWDEAVDHFSFLGDQV